MSQDPIVANSIAARFGYKPTGPRRPVFANQEVTFNATSEGADQHCQISRSIFVDELTVSMGIRETNVFPAANTQVEVLGLIAWAETDPTKADQGVTQFYPAALKKNDSTFGAQVNTGNAGSNSGTQWAENFLWGHIMKGTIGPTGQVGGEFGVHNTVRPYQYIPEASTITLHMDEDMSAAINLDAEIVVVMYYTPVMTVKVTR